MRTSDIARPWGLLLLLPLFLASQAQAETFTANHLVRACEGQTDFDQAVCYSYLAGWTEGRIAGQLDAFITETTGIGTCRPGNASNEQLRRVVLKHAAAHPERMHEIAGLFVFESVKSAWPCSPSEAARRVTDMIEEYRPAR